MTLILPFMMILSGGGSRVIKPVSRRLSLLNKIYYF